MAAIFGFTKNGTERYNLIKRMSSSMCSYDLLIQGDEYNDESISASYVYLKGNSINIPVHQTTLHSWVDGEIYNLRKVCDLFKIKHKNFSYAVIEAEKKGILGAFLNKIDGVFCGVIYNSDKKEIKCFSDRYGMKLLYWYFLNGNFIWSSKVKGILSLQCNKDKDKLAKNSFISLGYVAGERTLFENIKLIRPATILVYNINKKEILEQKFWKWADIQPSQISFDKAVDRLGHLFIESVNKCFNPKERIGVSLSGGLDSRAIVAAINLLYPDYKGYSYTFGMENSDDVCIAKKVINKTNWTHEIFYFSEIDWLSCRLSLVNDTDGMLNIMHMHGSEFIPSVSKKININLNGYLGDAVLGGSYLTDRYSFERNFKIIKKYSGNIDHDFYGEDVYPEAFLYMNRGRRFINMGATNTHSQIEQRYPFFDNELIEFVFSLPPEFRKNNRIYSTMLHKFFPNFFADIVWQKTGKLLSTYPYQRNSRYYYRAYKKMLDIFSYKKKNTLFINYTSLMKDEELIEKMINSISDKKERKIVTSCMNNKLRNNNELMFRLLTYKIYCANI